MIQGREDEDMFQTVSCGGDTKCLDSGDVLQAEPKELVGGLCDLSIKCSKETKCFAASVGMAAKGLIYQQDPFIDRRWLLLGLVPRWSD